MSSWVVSSFQSVPLVWGCSSGIHIVNCELRIAGRKLFTFVHDISLPVIREEHQKIQEILETLFITGRIIFLNFCLSYNVQSGKN